MIGLRGYINSTSWPKNKIHRLRVTLPERKYGLPFGHQIKGMEKSLTKNKFYVLYRSTSYVCISQNFNIIGFSLIYG